MDLRAFVSALVLYVSLTATCMGGVARKTQCPRLTVSQMRGEWKKLHNERFDELHWSFRLIPDMIDNVVNANKSIETNRSGARTTHLQGPRRCPKNYHVPLESNCPMRYVMHHDRDRIPTNIVHAVCLCKNCRYNSTSNNVGCMPIYTISKVLRRGPDCAYNWAFEKIPVACACESKLTIYKSTLTQVFHD